MPIEYPSMTPPKGLARAGELLLPSDLVLSAPRWLLARRKEAVEPRTVLLLPGFGAGERSMALVGRRLARAGHRVESWGLGRNTGNVPRLLEAVRERAAALHEEAGEALVAVGWSLGGYLAREAARDLPQCFRKVVTMGSPVVGGPRFTGAAMWYRARGWDLDAIEAEVAARFDTPLEVPVVAIFSKRDGIVAWQSCIDHWSPNVRHLRVSSTHLGLGFSPHVLDLVADEVSLDE
jgi:pimeloyl-ACP methyl ester carboxylesterase